MNHKKRKSCEMKRLILIVTMLDLVALAELPPSLDDTLFSLTGGTNYMAWMTTNGEIVFRKPFSVFTTAYFQSYQPTNDMPLLHHTITMEKRFYGITNAMELIKSLNNAESVLQKHFGRAFIRRQNEGCIYHSKCFDIDGLGWDVSFWIEGLPKDKVSSSYSVKALVYNSLHKAGRFVSCEDFKFSTPTKP